MFRHDKKYDIEAHILDSSIHPRGSSGYTTLPSGTENQTLRHDGTVWGATNILKTTIDGIDIQSSSGDTLNNIYDIDGNYAAKVHKKVTSQEFLIENEVSSSTLSAQKFLIHANTDFSDSSPYNHTPTVVNAYIDTSIKKFGAGSGRFENSVDPNPMYYVIYNDTDNDTDFGTGDWTITFWANLYSFYGNMFIITAGYQVWGSPSWCIKFNGTGTQLIFESRSGAGKFYCSYTLEYDVWKHYAFVVKDGVPYIFINGISQSVTIDTALGNILGGDLVLGAGKYDLVGYQYYGFRGNLDEIMILKDEALYTEDFSIPLDEYPSEDISSYDDNIISAKQSELMYQYTQDIHIGSAGMRIIFDGNIDGSGLTALGHNQLNNLDYASSGHTGFEPTITTLPLSKGGTNKALTANNGGIVYSDADSLEILSYPSAAYRILLSGQPPTWSSYTVTLSGNTTLSDWFNQSVKTTASPTFVNVNITGKVACSSLNGSGIQFYSGDNYWWMKGWNSGSVWGIITHCPDNDANRFVALGTANSGGTVQKWLVYGKGTGYVGIMTNTPDRTLDILDASNPQIRLTQTDNSKYVDLQATSNGDIVFNSNLGQLLKTDSSNYNVLIGQSAGKGASYEGYCSVLLGYQAGYLNTNTAGNEGKYNIYIGYQSGYGTTNNKGYYNTAVGYQALYSNTIGYQNIAIGHQTLYSNTEGYYNVAIGYKALYTNSIQSYNTAIGFESLKLNTTGNYNTAIGAYSLNANTSGRNNIAFGTFALYLNTTGNYNTAIGTYSLGNNTTGSYNFALGANSLNSNTTGNNNVAIGADSLFNNVLGEHNVSIGYRTLYINQSNYNTAIGNYSCISNVTGNSNIAIGYDSMNFIQSGNGNISIGYSSLYYNSTGGYNIAIGFSANYYYPSTITTATAVSGSGLEEGLYYYRVSFVLDTGETVLSNRKNVTTSGSNKQVQLDGIPTYSGSRTCTARKIYRTKVNGGSSNTYNFYYLVTTISDNSTTSYLDSTPDSSLTVLSDNPDYSIILGYNALAYKSSQMIVGSNSAPITEIWLGEGMMSSSPQDILLSSTSGDGTNINGSNLIIAGGVGTGSGGGGYISFKTAPAGSSGTTPGTLAEIMRITNAGIVDINGTLDWSANASLPKIYNQSAEPDIANNSMAFWVDSDDGKYYLILDVGGTQKKVELT